MNTFRRLFLSCTLLASLGGCRSLGPDEVRFAGFSYVGRDARFERAVDSCSEYLNPVLAGFHPDPSICRKGDDYFLVNSSFTFYPSIPIFHSRDLVHWRQLGFVLDRPEQVPLDSLRFNRAIYAPDISYNPHNDTFYVINTCVDGIENFIVKCRDPFAGNWSDPIPLPEVEGIDPSLFFDDDGRAYLLHNGMPPGERQWNSHRALWLWEFDTVADRVVGEPVLLLDGGVDFAAQPEWLEGPHIYKHDGEYVLLAAEGGTYEGHSQVALKSSSVKGPYVPYPRNPVLTQRDLPADRPDKVTSTGHADMVRTPDGQWYSVFLGCRPYADDFYNTGRETFLLPVTWDDGFPVILPPGRAVPTVVRKEGLQPDPALRPTTGNFAWSTDFSEGLDDRWLMIRTPRSEWLRTDGRGLVLRDNGHTIDLAANPAFVGVRQQHTDFTAETTVASAVSEGRFGGLALFQNERHYLLFGRTHDAVVAVRADGGAEMLASVPVGEADAAKSLTLRVLGSGGRCDLEYAWGDGPFTVLAQDVDTRCLSTHTARGFNGVIIGLYTGRLSPAALASGE
ncbi:MAG: glycoside hydrolase family 43 protein [Alistipes sp.]|nr:glycoside hydrolase family 43 protein [Alistipes sp.]